MQIFKTALPIIALVSGTLAQIDLTTSSTTDFLTLTSPSPSLPFGTTVPDTTIDITSSSFSRSTTERTTSTRTSTATSTTDIPGAGAVATAGPGLVIAGAALVAAVLA